MTNMPDLTDISSYCLINATLRNRSFTHPTSSILEGEYNFVRFNDDQTIALDNNKTGERVDVVEVIFHAMRTPLRNLEAHTQSEHSHPLE